MRVCVFDSEIGCKVAEPAAEDHFGIEVSDELLAKHAAAKAVFEAVDEEFSAVVDVLVKEERMREKIRIQAQLAERRKANLIRMRAMK